MTNHNSKTHNYYSNQSLICVPCTTNSPETLVLNFDQCDTHFRGLLSWSFHSNRIYDWRLPVYILDNYTVVYLFFARGEGELMFMWWFVSYFHNGFYSRREGARGKREISGPAKDHRIYIRNQESKQLF